VSEPFFESPAVQDDSPEDVECVECGAKTHRRVVSISTDSLYGLVFAQEVPPGWFNLYVPLSEDWRLLCGACVGGLRRNTDASPPKLGLAEIDGEVKLVPQDGERLTVPASAGRHVHNGTDEIKGYDGSHPQIENGANAYVERLADQLEAMGVGEMLRSGQAHVAGYEESCPPGTVITERADVRFINEDEVLASCGQLSD
jgi:hypothetical protein